MTPAVEHVIQALTLDEPLDAAVTELGNARGSAGFDLRENRPATSTPSPRSSRRDRRADR